MVGWKHCDRKRHRRRRQRRRVVRDPNPLCSYHSASYHNHELSCPFKRTLSSQSLHCSLDGGFPLHLHLLFATASSVAAAVSLMDSLSALSCSSPSLILSATSLASMMSLAFILTKCS